MATVELETAEQKVKREAEEKSSNERETLRASIEAEINQKEPGIKVFDWTFGNDETGEVRVFVRQPNRYVKNAAIDEETISKTKSWQTLFETCVIKEHTDKRVHDENPENDMFYYAVLNKMDSLIIWYSIDFLKKK